MVETSAGRFPLRRRGTEGDFQWLIVCRHRKIPLNLPFQRGEVPYTENTSWMQGHAQRHDRLAPSPKTSSTLACMNDAAHATTDEALMLRYQAGDAAAFDELYARHRQPMYRFITRQLQYAHHDQADEVFQEVWMNVIEARERYQANASFRTYLYALAHHRVMDYFRAHRRAELRLFDSTDETVIENVAASRVDEPETRAMARDSGNALLRLLGALPAPQREVFLLSEEAGLSVEDIAHTTGVSFETAKSRLRYAFAKLREGMREHL